VRERKEREMRRRGEGEKFYNWTEVWWVSSPRGAKYL
jgi:hypothetical protein